MLDALIDKTDRFEQVRDLIASILKAESASQQALATAAGKDPTLWKLRVYVERSNPWEQWLADSPTDTSPIVSVWFDNDVVDLASSDMVRRQKYEGAFNIDCYGYGESSNIPAGGHTPGDKLAAFESKRAARLVRNILMSTPYRHLGVGVQDVIDRWVQSRTTFQPTIGDRPVGPVVATRLDLRVTYNEFAPQNTPETLEYLAIDLTRADDGELLAEVDFDYT